MKTNEERKNLEVLYKDESMFGYIGDIVNALKFEIEFGLEEKCVDEAIVTAFNEAVELEKEDCYAFYEVYYNPMGAYMFNKMIKKEEEK